MAAMFGARIGHLDTLIRRGEKEFKGGNFSSGVAFFKEAHQLVLELEGKLGTLFQQKPLLTMPHP